MAELRLKSTGTIKLFENDNTSSVTIASPASLGGDRTITLPDASVTLASGTMLATDGSGASLTALNASELGSGTVPTARLGSGSASSSVFLSGANTWIAAGGGKLELISAGAAASALYQDFDIFDSSSYDAYRCILTNVDGLQGNPFTFNFRDSGGALGGASYYYSQFGNRSSGTVYNSAGEGTGTPPLGTPLAADTSYPAMYDFIITDNPVGDIAGPTVYGSNWGFRSDWSDLIFANFTIWYNDSQTLTGFRIYASGSDNTTFDYQFYGLGK